MEEVWKDIKDYEGLYQVSNLGRVKSLSKKWISGFGAIRYKNESILKLLNVSGGYVAINLCKNSVRKLHTVHRLVAETFILNTNNLLQVNHINGIKTDNRVENLEWCTAKENMNHAFSNKLINIPKGENNKNAKLTNKEVDEIRKLKGTMTQREIAKIYGVHQVTISEIILNKKRKI